MTYIWEKQTNKHPNRLKSLKMLDAQIISIEYKTMIYEIILKIKGDTEMTLKFSFMWRAERFFKLTCM